MATNHHRTSISGRQNSAFLSLILLYLLAAEIVQAQSPPNGNNSNSNNNNPNYFTSAKFNPSMAVIIVVLISAFFFIGFFSIYIRQCGGGDRMNSLAAAAIGARSRRQRGLDSSILETFPTLVYAEVKEHKIGKGALECAICLNEFEDDDAIRLLPKCDHVFHQDCIDAWLATHVTCPVCRANYASDAAKTTEAATDAIVLTVAADTPVPAAENLVIAVPTDGERKEEMKELARIASKVRRNGSRRGRDFPRSHSTGHSMAQQEGGLDRFTLRLPENIRKDIIASGMLQRQRSLAVGSGGEGSSRMGGRSGRLGRSDRWPSVFVRSLSAKIPAWGNWRRGEEGSLRGKFAGGGFLKKNSDDSESSTGGLNRV